MSCYSTDGSSLIVMVYNGPTSTQTSLFCGGGQYIENGDYLYRDNNSPRGLWYNPGDSFYNIDTSQDSRVRDLVNHAREILGQTWGAGGGYLEVVRDTDYDTGSGTVRLYAGDRVYFSGGDGQARGTGTERSWILASGYSRGSGSVVNNSGYVLDPYSNSQSFRRLSTRI